MNAAEKLVRALYGLDAGAGDLVNPFDQTRKSDYVHPDVEFSLYGMTGTKEVGRGRDAYLAFTSNCLAALSDRSDEFLDVVSIDEQCVFVRARASRKSASTGVEAHYEWATLTRVEDGRITSVTDMLDRDAQVFWGQVAG